MIQNYISTVFVAHWLSNDLWKCFEDIRIANFPTRTVRLQSDEDVALHISNGSQVLFVSHQIQKKLFYPTVNIIVSKHLSQLNIRNVVGPTVVITKSKDDLSLLWLKSKVTQLIALVVENDGINTYRWNPYERNQCKKDVPTLSRTSSCIRGTWQEKVPRFVDKRKNNFRDCSIKIQRGFCRGMLYRHGIEWKGPEQWLVSSICNHFNLKPLYGPFNADFYDYSIKDDEPRGGMQLLWEQQADLAIGCLGLLQNIWCYFDFTPPHFFDSLSWFVPTPKLRQHYTNFYSGFSSFMWYLIIASYCTFLAILLTAGTIKRCKKYQSPSLCAIYALSNLVGIGTSLEKGIIQGIFTLINLFALHLLAFYQSQLLYHLFRASFENPISTPWEAVEHGLTPTFRVQHSRYLNETTDSLMQTIVFAGNFNISNNVSIDYDSIVFHKTAFFLGMRYTDQSIIRLLYQNVQFNNIVRILSPPFQNYPFVLLMSPGNLFLEPFSLKIRQLHEGGFIHYWLEKTMEDIRKKELTLITKGNSPITFDAIAPAFYLLLIGDMASILIIACEIIKKFI